MEFAPFRAAIEAEVATIMTAHVLVPSLDEDAPATLSKRIVGMLREELGYQGVILSDDLEMKAIAGRYTVPDAAVRAIAAGCDGVLICSGDHDAQAAALEALVHAVEEERIPIARIDDALRRQQRAKERFLAAPGRRAAEGRQGAAAGARPGRAPGDRRRNGALRVMRKPRALAAGDRIAIVAPASPFDRDEFDRGVEEIRRLGFEPVYDESVFARRVVRRRRRPTFARRRFRRRGTTPPSPGSLPCAAATGRRRSCRSSMPTRCACRPSASSATAISPRC